MFYTERDPYTLEKVYVAKNPHDKAMQRALMRYFDPKNRDIVEEALIKARRTDLIGNSPSCLIKGSPKTANRNRDNTGNQHSAKNKPPRSRYEKRKK